jgi:hypothetical protein
VSWVNKPVQMIVYSKIDGSMQPIRFKVSNEDGEDQVINIKGSRLKEYNKDRRIYECAIELNGMKKRIEVWFYIDSCKWIINNIK